LIVISSTLIIVSTFGLIALLSRRMTRWEKSCAFASWFLHVCFAFVQVWLHTQFYNGVGDMFQYIDAGRAMAHLMEVDFPRFAWETVKLFFHIGANGTFAEGGISSTQAMEAATAFIMFCVGDSMLAACLFVGALASVGQLYLYYVVRYHISSASHRTVVVALLLVPSVLFWSSAVTKEGLVVFFFALLGSGALLISNRRLTVGLASALVGTVGVAMLKPYILSPFILGVVAWVYCARMRRTGGRIRVAPVIGAAVIGVIGLAATGTIFPEFSLSELAKEAARQQEVGAEVGGGSYIQVGSVEARSFLQQLEFVPLAFVDSMFRPLIFEARNAPMLAAAFESTALTILSVYLVIRLRVRHVIEALLRSPLLSFCVVFTLSFAIAVGLATTNLGTLSRYRMPMMPWYALALVLLGEEVPRTAVRVRRLTDDSRRRTLQKAADSTQ
jgi:hypothetical protein